jgi:hypothetical protein
LKNKCEGKAVPFHNITTDVREELEFHSFLTLAVNGRLHASEKVPSVSTEEKADGLYWHFGEENTSCTCP